MDLDGSEVARGRANVILTLDPVPPHRQPTSVLLQLVWLVNHNDAPVSDFSQLFFWYVAFGYEKYGVDALDVVYALCKAT